MNIDINSVNLPARLLGAFFYYPPDSDVLNQLYDSLFQVEQLFAWENPKIITQQSQIMADTVTDQELDYQYSVLFEGQGFMPAPPWGSVYLDKENLLMGESTMRYRQFLQQHQLIIDTGINEPEDQFGLMLMAFALLIETNRAKAAKELIQDHLMPWAPRYLKLLSENDISPFYKALSIIAESYLNQLVKEFNLTVPNYYLYK